MKQSAGIIPFRINKNNEVEFFVGHPGGFYNAGKDEWYFLKGGVEEGEDWTDAAIREFKEETGLSMEDCESNMLMFLGEVRQSAHKTAIAYALYYPNIDPDQCHSNLCEDGLSPEIDRYRWMTFEQLKGLTHPTHLTFYRQIIDMCANC